MKMVDLSQTKNFGTTRDDATNTKQSRTENARLSGVSLIVTFYLWRSGTDML